MATINLGAIKFNWKGAYNSGTSYAVDDVVSSGGNSYVCIQAHSNQAVGNATAYWNIMSSAGTNGTDVGATLANKEIAFKTNAGAVDGIPIGTAGQFLKVNSGATGYEYGTISTPTSDFVKLATITASSTGEVQFNGHFTSDYDMYKIMMYDVYNSTNSHLAVRFMRGGSNVTSSNYKMVLTRTYTDSTPSNSVSASRESWNHNSLTITSGDYPTQTANSARLQGEITLFNPLATDTRKVIQSNISWQRNGDDNTMHHSTGYGRDESAYTALSGINITNGSGNFTSGKFKLYGIK